MGGNDLLAAFGDTTAARMAIDQVRINATSLLRELRKLCGPGTPIAVATVYDPTDGLRDAASYVGLPPWREETALLDALNSTLRSVAVAHGAAVAEVHGGFMGHGLSVGDPTKTKLSRPTGPCGTAGSSSRTPGARASCAELLGMHWLPQCSGARATDCRPAASPPLGSDNDIII
jgi:hypothetical protein